MEDAAAIGLNAGMDQEGGGTVAIAELAGTRWFIPLRFHLDFDYNIYIYIYIYIYIISYPGYRVYQLKRCCFLDSIAANL
jgi:hypothetical protein